MFYSPLVGRRWALALALIVSLGACQRATYQFQQLAATPYQVPGPAPITDSLLVVCGAQEHTTFLEVGRLRQTRHAARFTLVAKISQAVQLTKSPRAVAAASATQVASKQEILPVAEPLHYRSRGVAILLAALALTYLPLSLHNFYLGYYGRGAIAIALVILGISLTILGLLGGLFSSGASLTGLGVVGLAILGGWLIWQIFDFVRIITGNLKPKNGEYYPRLFQLHAAKR